MVGISGPSLEIVMEGQNGAPQPENKSVTFSVTPLLGQADALAVITVH